MRRILTSLNLVSSEKRAVENSFAGKKLCDFTKEESDQLCAHLRHIAQYVCGIQHPIDVRAMAYINRMLNRYYSNLTMADITDAFEMRSAGELGELEHYGSFSTDFIGAVLRRYSAIRQGALKKFSQKATQQKVLEQPKNYVSNEQVYNSLISWVKWQQKLPIVWLWDAAHQHLVSINKLPNIENLTYEQKQKTVIQHLLELFPEIK
jgi:hypothetical protein